MGIARVRFSVLDVFQRFFTRRVFLPLRDRVQLVNPPYEPKVFMTMAVPMAPYIPATRSSAIIPKPPGNASNLRAGYGLKMSKRRKRLNETMTHTNHGPSTRNVSGSK